MNVSINSFVRESESGRADSGHQLLIAFLLESLSDQGRSLDDAAAAAGSSGTPDRPHHRNGINTSVSAAPNTNGARSPATSAMAPPASAPIGNAPYAMNR
jgi:hypothetical protein